MYFKLEVNVYKPSDNPIHDYLTGKLETYKQYASTMYIVQADDPPRMDVNVEFPEEIKTMLVPYNHSKSCYMKWRLVAICRGPFDRPDATERVHTTVARGFTLAPMRSGWNECKRIWVWKLDLMPYIADYLKTLNVTSETDYKVRTELTRWLSARDYRHINRGQPPAEKMHEQNPKADGYDWTMQGDKMTVRHTYTGKGCDTKVTKGEPTGERRPPAETPEEVRNT